MRSAALALFLAGCIGPARGTGALPHWTAPPSAPLEVAVLGATAATGPDLALLADVASRDAELLVLTGDLSSSARRDWRHRAAWLRRFERPTLAVVGADEARARARFLALHGDGPIDGATWSATDVALGASRWRLLAVDVTAEGAAWQDQMFWLPKAVSQQDYTHLVVVLGTAPWTLAAEVDDDALRDRAREILATVEAHAGLDRLRLVIGGGTGTQEALLPAGPWGELWLNAGSAGAATRAVVSERPGPRTTTLTLAAGLADELGAEPAPVGWWELELDGDRASARLRTEAGAGRFEERWRIDWTESDGWSRAIR